eukprot:gene2887-8198_t
MGRTWTRSVDAVLVDGDHAFAAVLRDIEAWWPKLAPDGLMLGHDAFTHRDHPMLTRGSRYTGWRWLE